MSAVNLGSPDIADAHDAVRNGKSAWVLYSLTATNDLKVQEEGGRDGSLEDLADEFSDGKMQFAFARVTDDTTKLQKFVRINWCGGGVPTFKKSRFTQFAEDVARVLTGAHVSLQARTEADVEPSLVRKRVAESGGSKYSTHAEAPQKLERPAPVGTSYTPVGRPDIASMTSKSRPEAAPTVGTTWTPRHNELQDIRAQAQKDKDKDRTTASQAPPAAPDSPPAPAPPPAAPRPAPTQTSSNFQASAASQQTPEPASSKYEPPAPVGTAYTPVSLPRAGKLGDRLAAFQQGSGSGSSAGSSSGGAGAAGGKKLTWSERQALTRKQQEEEEAASAAAIGATPVARSTAPLPPAAPMAPPPPPIAMESRPSTTSVPQAPPAPAAPAPPPAPPAPALGGAAVGAAAGAAAAVREADAQKEAEEEEADRQAEKLDQLKLAEVEANEAAAVPKAPGQAAVGSGQRARVLYEYTADEENEVDLEEGGIVEDVDQIDEGWWSGTYNGKTGLFPANYVELIDAAEEQPREDEEEDYPQPPAAPPAPPAPSAPAAPPAPPMPPRADPEPEETAGSGGPRAKALYDYTADEDNELTFAEEAEITDIEFSSDEWWTGTCGGARGLFPANYVELVEE